MLALILVILALVCALLALFRVPERFSFVAAGLLCLALAILLGHANFKV